MRVVKLTWFELWQASQVGCRRHIEAVQAGFGQGAVPDQNWNYHVEGAAAEMATAKAFGWYWSASVNTFQDADIGNRIQIRWRSKPTYELIVRPKDRDEDYFILVRGQSPQYEIVGGILGRDAKRDEWLQTYGGRKPAYFVPNDALCPVEEMADAVAALEAVA